MKKFLSKMFEEKGDDVSLMRVMTFLSMIFGFIIAMTGMFFGQDLNALAVLVSAFVTPSILGKTVQKFAEKDSGDGK